jgi:sulfate adenylyltransferase
MAEQRSIKLIAPHGGVLINRLLDGEMRDALRERAQRLTRVPLTPLNVADLECVSTGVYSPLTGYMGEADYKSVMFDMHLTNGLPWTVPVTLAVDEDLANRIKIGQSVALAEPVEGNGERLLAVLTVTEKFKYDKQLEAEKVFRTTDAEHPGVARVYAQGEVYLAGDIWVFDRPLEVETSFTDIRFTPADTRRMFVERGWRRIVAFQTRNPIHRAHEYLQKVALEVVDGLMLHPLVGETKSDDVPADVRVASYQAILETYYPMDRVLLNVFPAAMRYGGPREAIFHAIARKNYGCSHFIVGRDHAGVGKYYGSYDAHYIFDEFDPRALDITPLFFEHAFYCRKCEAVVTSKTCPHGKDDWVFLSGTQVREKLAKGELLPVEFTRPEVSKVLIEGMRAKNGQ